MEMRHFFFDEHPIVGPRHFYFDKYHTFHDWGLVLTDKSIPDPEPKTNYIQLDGVSGSLDLTEALTGEVAYNDRTIAATFSASCGTYQQRETVRRQIAAAIHGRKVQIIEPDDPEHYFLGRVTIKDGTRHASYSTFTLEAVCEPWRYARAESTRRVEVTAGDPQDVVIENTGVKTVCPDIQVEGAVTLTYEGGTVDLTTGAYKVADIKLRYGANVVGVSGTGTVTFTYREATL
jgi:hypothetical protein